MYSKALPNANCNPKEIAIAMNEPNWIPFPVCFEAASASRYYIYIYLCYFHQYKSIY